MCDIEIFFVHLFNDFSGSPRVFRDAIDCENSHCDKKYIFTSSHNGFLSGTSCNNIIVPYYRSSNKYLVLLSYLFSQFYVFFVLSFFLIRSKIRGNKTRVVVNTLLPFGANLAAKFFSDELVCYIHEVSISPKYLDIFLKFVIRFSANKIIYVSNYLKSTYKLSYKQQLVIHNGLRSDFPEEITVDRLAKFQKKQILFVGSLKFYKGIYNLIELAKQMDNFDFVAAVNCSESELLSLKNTHIIPENLKLEVKPDNLNRLYAESFLLLNLSIPDLWIETFGLSILEGFAYACPAIVPPIGGQLEFSNENNCIVIDSRNIGLLKNAIYTLANDYDHWSKLSLSAEKTAKLFSASIYKNKIIPYFAIEYSGNVQ